MTIMPILDSQVHAYERRPPVNRYSLYALLVGGDIDLIARKPRTGQPGYSGLVVVFERVVVVPPIGSVSVFVCVSVLPETPSF